MSILWPNGQPPCAWGNSSSVRHDSPGCGQPPCAWGKRWRVVPVGRSVRSTPVCVGKTSGRFVRCEAHTVNPRVRGENVVQDSMVAPDAGQPPCAWGKHMSSHLGLVGVRSTPVCVGKTGCPKGSPRLTPVNPRVRGENKLQLWANEVRRGQPPCAWGKRRLKEAEEKATRSTPVCVGKTPRGCRLPCPLPVNPRVRGENLMLQFQHRSSYGQPPCAWGKRSELAIRRTAPRSTPVCVGKTPKGDVYVSV